jgi:Ca2+-binding RTX toxin-like protein
MMRHAVRLTSVLAGVSAGVLLAAGPAGALEIPQPTPVPLPSVLECSTPWTHIVVGTAQDDDLVGTDANDLIIGLGGDDTIYGGGGRDTLLGGDGQDVLVGGPDDDCIIGGAGSDTSVLFMYTSPNGTDENHSVTARYQY